MNVQFLSADDFTSPVNSGALYDGDKFFGGFGATNVFTIDYWTLRHRSAQLFTENLYARGLIRRLVTNIINTGLGLESTPDEKIIGLPEDSLNDWREDVENRYHLWAKNPTLCDYYGRQTYGELQKEAYREALVEGDILVVLHIDEVTGFPKVQLVSGSLVEDPDQEVDNDIVHGVELDAQGRHVAYWVTQDNGSTRIPAYGPSSGRRVAWMFYGTDKRKDDVRGQPILSLILQSLKELDRYRDATVRKAVINAIIAMFIQKDADKMSTKPMTGGAVRRGSGTVTDNTGTERTFNLSEHTPGVYFEELQTGEKPVPYSIQGTDVNFGAFEASIVNAIGWANETPPEILQLGFSHNYSASQAATNEYKIYQNMERTRIGDGILQVVWVEYFTSSVMMGKIAAPGFLEARNDPTQWDIFGAWTSADWSGAIKPAVDLLKMAKGYHQMVTEGWITNERTARELSGTKFRKNIKRLKKENELKAEALAPILAAQAAFNNNSGEDVVDALESVITDALEGAGKG